MADWFVPILAGATLRDRFVACVGGLFGIMVTSLVSWALLRDHLAAALIVAPMGASAVLVFAIPASPLAQPWPVIGGNIVSALVGVAAAQFVSIPHLAAGLAVGAAILAMSLLRCLHPPGGGTALMAALASPGLASPDYLFALAPVGINAVLLAVSAYVFHRVSGHSYPHRAAPITAPQSREGIALLPHPDDLAAALAELGETYDISPEDLELLLQRVNFHAGQRHAAASRSDPAPTTQ